MKKYLFILLLLLSFTVTAQVKIVRVVDATTPIGENIPEGTQVFNKATDELWIAKNAVLGTATLTTASSSFKKSGDDLGSHTATTNLALGGNNITSTGSIEILPEQTTGYVWAKTPNGFFANFKLGLYNSAGTYVTQFLNQNITQNQNIELPNISAGVFAMEADPSGFNGILSTTDNTLQEIAQKVNDIVIPIDTNLSIATTGEINTGSIDNKAISPLGFANSDYASDITANNAKLTANATNVVAALNGATLTGGLNANNQTITNFVSTGINDNATSTAITIDASENIGIQNALPLAPIHVGDRAVNNSVDAMVLISRDVDDGNTGNAHAFSDSSDLSRSGDIGYNSFDARINTSGSSNFDHYISFQAAPVFNSTGTTGELFGFGHFPVVNSGTVTNHYGLYLQDPTGSGTITNNYGVYVKGNAKNYFNGNTGFGTNNPQVKAHILGSSELFRLESTSSTGEPFMSFYQNGTRRSYLQYVDSGDKLHIASEYGDVSILTGTGGTETEKVKVEADGDVYIGQAAQRFYFRNDGQMQWGSTAQYGVLSWGSNEAIIGALSSSKLSLWSSGTVKATITTSGNFLIGTTSDDAVNKLQVNGYTKASGYKTTTGVGDNVLLDDGSVLSKDIFGSFISNSKLNANHYAKRVLNNGGTFESIDQLFYDLNNVTTESIQFTPNAVQTDTIYGIQTSDYENGTDGDFVYIRSGTATRTNVNGIVETVASNVARIDYSVNPSGELLLEPSKTNYAKYSEDFSNAYWVTETGTSVTANQAIAPDGTLTADLLTGNGTSGIYNVESAPTPSVTFAHSVWLRTVSGTATLSLKDVSVGGGGTINVTTEWQRFNKDVVLGTGNSGIWIDDIPVNGVYVWGAQFEEADLTSYIPTTTAYVTRAAEDVDLAGSTSTINSQEGVLYIEAAALYDDITDRHISLSDGTADEQVVIGYDAYSNRIEASYFTGGLEEAKLSYVVSDITDLHKIAFKWASADFALWIDGTEVATSSSGSVAAADTFDELQLEDGDIGNDFIGRLRELKVFTTALSDTELTALTSKADYTPKHLARTDVDPYFTKDVTVQGDLIVEGTITFEPKFVSQGGATDTLAASDHLYTIDYTSGSAKTVTIPTNATVEIPVGTVIYLINTGAGDLTFSTTGITLNDDLTNQTIVQYARRTLTKTATDTWLLSY